MLSLCFRIPDSGIRVSRVVSKIDSSCRCEVVRVSSGDIGGDWKGVRGGYVGVRVIQLLG
jgi:hypothetical protein